MEKQSTVLFNLDPRQYMRLFKGMETQIKELRAEIAEQQPVELITKAQATEIFHCDLSTINAWCRQGKLKAYKMGGRKYLKRSEIFNSLIPLARKID